MAASSKRRRRGSINIHVSEYVTVDLDDVFDEISDEALLAEMNLRGTVTSACIRVEASERAEDIRDLCERIERLVAPDQRIEAGVLLRNLQHIIGLPRIGIPTKHKIEQASA
jgi:hypothetical protein